VIVIVGLHGLLAAGAATTGEWSDQYFGLAIDGNSQTGRVLPSTLAGRIDVLENGVGLAYFF